jgi:hypothetical protein
MHSLCILGTEAWLVINFWPVPAVITGPPSLLSNPGDPTFGKLTFCNLVGFNNHPDPNV